MSKPSIVIGIDPGNTGAIAILNGGVLTIHDMPVVETKRNRKNKSHINAAMVASLLREWAATPGVCAYVELVGSFPKMGVSGAFAFGRGAGILEGALAGLLIPYTIVTPQVWMRDQGVVKSKGKGASRARAAALFPKYAQLFSRVKDDGHADAALIARYGRAQVG